MNPASGIPKNPSLLLDKQHDLLESDEPGQESRLLANVTRGEGDYAACERLRQRIKEAVESRPSQLVKRMRTKGPLAMHLARSTAFENACLAMHPVLAVPYLPASGLKGLARSYAENCSGAGEAEIDRIFGPRAKDAEEVDSESSLFAGSVVFYDALPAKKATMMVDIVNNHHPGYYGGTENHYEDKEDPNPVFFLSLKQGAEFEFYLAGRSGTKQDDVEKAWNWLEQGLVLLGAGAKTNAGYGRFAGEAQATESRLVREFRLKLVSPAFLAGAQQGREDCNLRAASLRGVLRWWWRAIFGGLMPINDLRDLEGKIWGTSTREGAVALVVSEISVKGPEPWPRLKQGRTPKETNRGYLAYGMEGNAKAGKPPRFYLKPDSEWILNVVARSSVAGVSASDAMNHALAALMFFDAFGGIGAKSRKGYGSLCVSPPPGSKSLNEWIQTQYKSEYKSEVPAVGPRINNRIEKTGLKLNTNNIEAALDKIARSYRQIDKGSQDFGLPRGRFQPELSRCSSPLHFKLKRNQRGEYLLNVVAMPSPSINKLEKDQKLKDDSVLKRAVYKLKQLLGEGA
jgi:CRISPR-associated protein Cmr6